MVRGIRGAITVDNNNRDEILAAVRELLEKIIESNGIKKEDMASIIFTLTPDLDAVFPAVAARGLGITDVPLMCMGEIPVPGALEKCVRILMHVNTDKANGDIKHIYLREAVRLRPDLAGNTK